MKPSALRRRWKSESERRVRKAQRDIIDLLEPLSEESGRRVIRVIVACHEAGCLDDLGVILKSAEPPRQPESQ